MCNQFRGQWVCSAQPLVTESTQITGSGFAFPVAKLHLKNSKYVREAENVWIGHDSPQCKCTVDELVVSRGDYKSYKVGISAAYYDQCYSVNIWPINARIKRWINYRTLPSSVQKRDTGNLTSIQLQSTCQLQSQSFRSSVSPEQQ